MQTPKTILNCTVKFVNKSKISNMLVADKIKDCESATKCLRVITALLCSFGIILSLYAYHVETSKERDENYTAMCDISEHMSCTAAFSSKYGKGFGLLEYFVGKNSVFNQPNSVFGVIFYSGFFPLGEVPNITISKILILLTILSNICSVYLAYILMFILHDFCVVCVTTYVINAFLLVCSIFRYRLHKLKMIDAVKKTS